MLPATLCILVLYLSKVPAIELYTNYKKIDIDEYGAAAQSRQSARLFLQSSELGPPLTRRLVCPPFGSGWGGEGGRHTRLRERGVPIFDEGTDTVVL
jgi:hypothetical protein